MPTTEDERREVRQFLLDTFNYHLQYDEVYVVYKDNYLIVFHHEKRLKVIKRGTGTIVEIEFVLW